LELNDIVEENHNFYIGKQWEGVVSNGLATPVYNNIKRLVGFKIANLTSDNISIQSTPIGIRDPKEKLPVEPSDVFNKCMALFVERTALVKKIRDFTRDAALNGDGCFHIFWNPEIDAGQDVMGDIDIEVIENTRVFFGDPQTPDVESQPFIIIAQRKRVRDVLLQMKEEGNYKEMEKVHADSDRRHGSTPPSQWITHQSSDDKCTVLTVYWKDDKTGDVWLYECTEEATVKEPIDIGIRLYPVVWLNWDTVRDSYHGYALVTGLQSSQIFINRAMAMVMANVTRQGFGTTIFDKTRIPFWTNKVGAAIGVNGGDVNSVAKIIDPPAISPQIAEFIQMSTNMMNEVNGATAAALGNERPDNTSAIVALQRASLTADETTKQYLYNAIEQVGRICLEFMAEFYGIRQVMGPPSQDALEMAQFAGQMLPGEIPVDFDFIYLKNHPLQLKLDVGASSYFSEIAAQQTLDNLLMGGFIDMAQYLERIPESNLPDKGKLLAEKLKEKQMQQGMQMQQMAQMAGAPIAPEPRNAPKTGGGGKQPHQYENKENPQTEGVGSPEVQGGRGYNHLAHAINQSAGLG